MTNLQQDAEPYPLAFAPESTALLIIDMQRDFLEPVIDKAGKGAFYETDLHLILQNRGINTLLVCGVTTEVCVHTLDPPAERHL